MYNRELDKLREVQSSRQNLPDISRILDQAQDKQKQKIINALPLDKLSQTILSLADFASENKTIEGLKAALKVIEEYRQNSSTEDKSQGETISPTTLNAFDKVIQFRNPSRSQY